MMYSLVQSHQFCFETILGDAIKRKRILHNCAPFRTIRLCITTILFMLVLLTIRIILLYLHVAMILYYVLLVILMLILWLFNGKEDSTYLRIWGEFNRDHYKLYNHTVQDGVQFKRVHVLFFIYVTQNGDK